MKRLVIGITFGLSMLLGACAHSPQASKQVVTYAVAAEFALGGEGRWDLLAVDSARHHLFLSRSDRVDVVDTRNGKLLASIAGVDGAHGIAIAPALRRGFATAGHSDTVTEFDLETLKRVRDIKVSGHSPDAILYDAFSRHVFVFNAKSNNASVVDPVTGREITTIAFTGNPELGTSDGKGHVFVNIEDMAELVEIDSTSLKAAQTWPLPGCEEPTGLAIDTDHARLFSVCQNQTMSITDAHNGRQVARVEIGSGPDGAVFDTQRQLAFSPNGRAGTLSVVHEDDPEHFRVTQTLTTQTSARTIALDQSTHRMYLPAARFEPQVEGSKERSAMLPGSFSVLEIRDGARR